MIAPLDSYTRHRLLAWCERNADGVVVAVCLIAMAVITRIPSLWS